MLEQLVRELIQLDVPYDAPGLPPEDLRISPAEEVSEQAAEWLGRRLSYVLATEVRFPPGPLRIEEAVAAVTPLAQRPNARGKTFLDCLAASREALGSEIAQWDYGGLVRQLLHRPIPEGQRDHPPDWRPPFLYRLCELLNTRYNRALDGTDYLDLWEQMEQAVGVDLVWKVFPQELPVIELAQYAYLAYGRFIVQRYVVRIAKATGWRARGPAGKPERMVNVVCEMAAVLLSLPFSQCRPDSPLASLCQLRNQPSEYYRSEARMWALALHLSTALGRHGRWKRETKLVRLSLLKAAKQGWSIGKWTEQWLRGAARPKWWNVPIC